MSGGGDNNAQKCIKDEDGVMEYEDHKVIQVPEEQKMVGGLRVIKLPPSPDDFCTICDPIMKTPLRTAVFTTFFCWLPLGIVPVIFGLVSIYFALKAENSNTREIKQLYSDRSNTISWIGMMLFVTILTVSIIIIATSGIL